ncbi:phage tail assembly chaperone [Pseudomonas sichuanensis]|uniref:phage tail assembly chaperone n=1 Tax=Pseudomonas sichuanensis TaxID=2213015 RepID=UPI000DA676BE|nr:hypothetical protein [Pseudomonas sichuanensis]
MSEFQLGDNTYRISKLSVFNQWHLSRKVAPIIPTLIPVFVKLQQASGVSPLSGDLAGMAELITPFADGIANMDNESSEFILSTCLSVVQRKQGDAWVPIWSNKGAVCMFDDIDLGSMIQLCFRVIKESLGPFFSGMLTGQSTPQD